MEGIDFIAVSVLIGTVGIIIVNRKEKQRCEEFERMAEQYERMAEQYERIGNKRMRKKSYMARRGMFDKVYLWFSFCFVAFMFTLMMHVLFSTEGPKDRNDIIPIVFVSNTVTFFYIYRELCLNPLFAIVGDSFVIWKNCGFAAPKEYELSEVRQSEERVFFRKRTVMRLYYKGKYIQDIDTSNYRGIYQILIRIEDTIGK